MRIKSIPKLQIQLFEQIQKHLTFSDKTTIIYQSTILMHNNNRNSQMLQSQQQKRHRSVNVFTYVSKLNQPEQIIRKHVNKKTLSYLKKGKFLQKSAQYFGMNVLCLYKVKDTFAYKHYIPILCDLFVDIHTILFWNSEITDQMFSKIDSQYWVGRRLSVEKCNIENILPGKCQSIIFGRLKCLEIVSDPIGNKGIKKLMKIEKNNMINLRIMNTNCTSDVIKLLKKNISSCNIYVKQKDRFDFLRLHKQYTHFKCYRTTNPLAIIIYVDDLRDTILYLGYLSKVYQERDNESVNLILYVYQVDFMRFANEQLMFSCNAYNKMYHNHFLTIQ